MAWFTDRHFFLLAVFLYGISTVYSIFLWRSGFRRDDRINYFILLAGYVLHVTAMSLRGFSLQHCPVNNLFEATVFFTWAILTAYLVIGLMPRLRFLGAFLAPAMLCIGIFALMPSLDPPHGPKPQFTGVWPSLHAALSLQAYGAFGLGAVAAVMFLTQEHDLKFHKLRAIISVLPPIQRLEKITSRLVANGFLLLTTGLILGAVALQHSDKKFSAGDIKVVWSLLVWEAYLILLVMHKRFGMGGRRFAWGAVGIFVFVLLTFWGTNLLSPIHQQ